MQKLDIPQRIQQRQNLTSMRMRPENQKKSPQRFKSFVNDDYNQQLFERIKDKQLMRRNNYTALQSIQKNDVQSILKKKVAGPMNYMIYEMPDQQNETNQLRNFPLTPISREQILNKNFQARSLMNKENLNHENVSNLFSSRENISRTGNELILPETPETFSESNKNNKTSASDAFQINQFRRQKIEKWQRQLIQDQDQLLQKIQPSNNDQVINKIVKINQRPYENSVVPNLYRHKNIVNPQKIIFKNELQKNNDIEFQNQTQYSEQVKLKALNEVQKYNEQKKERKIEVQVLNQKFKDLQDTVEDIKKSRNNYLWEISRKYDKSLKQSLENYSLNQRKKSVARARQLEQLLSKRCRMIIGSNDQGPDSHEVMQNAVGPSSMLSAQQKKLCGDVLKRIGILQTMTYKEKYEKAFDQLILSPEEMKKKEKEMKEAISHIKQQEKFEIKSQGSQQNLKKRGVVSNQDARQDSKIENKNIAEKDDNQRGQILESQMQQEQDSESSDEEENIRIQENLQSQPAEKDNINYVTKQKIVLPHLDFSTLQQVHKNEDVSVIDISNEKFQEFEQDFQIFQTRRKRDKTLDQKQSVQHQHRQQILDNIQTFNQNKKINQKQIDMNKSNRQNVQKLKQEKKKMVERRQSHQESESQKSGQNSHTENMSEGSGSFDFLSSLGIKKIEQRLFSKYNINQRERIQLQKIFTEVQDDPNWFHDSILYELYQKRISLVEMMSLLTSDDEWSHFATKQQTQKVFNLFDKVYGYAKGRSKFQEQAKRYQKQNKVAQNDQQPEQAQLEKVPNSKHVLKEMFDVKSFNTGDLIERYSNYLAKIFQNGWEKHTMKKYQRWLAQETAAQQQLNFYERMKIDEIIREGKNADEELKDSSIKKQEAEEEPEDEDDQDNSIENQNQNLTTQQSNSSDDDDQKQMSRRKQEKLEKQIRKDEKKIKKLAQTFGIDMIRATKIYKILIQKGVSSKAMDTESEDEELRINPQLKKITEKTTQEVQQICEEKGENFSKKVKKVFISYSQIQKNQVQEFQLKKKQIENKKQFSLDKILRVPGQYMLGNANDEDFNDYIIRNMKEYLHAKDKLANMTRKQLKTQSQKFNKIIQGFKSFSGKKQIDYKIKKRENDVERHGHSYIQKLINTKQIEKLEEERQRKSVIINIDEQY